MPSVYLYIPNIIGYFRIIINFIAFAVCYANRPLFAILYFFSFVLDGVDGWFARKFNQASTFRAVLDMVTDRVSTACLLALLSQCYRPGLIFLMLLGLDITSHWFQIYSSFLSGKASHKDVKHTSNWLLKLYYGYRPFMDFCCVSCEVLYIILFLFADEKSTSLLSVCRVVLNQSPLIVLVFIPTLVGWAVKQVTNIIQLKTAADTCVEAASEAGIHQLLSGFFFFFCEIASIGFTSDMQRNTPWGLVFVYQGSYIQCFLTMLADADAVGRTA